MKFYLNALRHKIPGHEENEGVMFQVILQASIVTMILTCEIKTSLNGRFAASSLYIPASDMMKFV
jgi:hypothetical protein